MSRADASNNKKENYILSSKIMNEIFWNYSIITQENSQFDVLKNIIIPRFAQLIFSDNPEILNSKILFHFYESISNLFLEKHKDYLLSSKFIKKHQISFSKDIPQQDFHNLTIDGFHNKINNIIHSSTSASNTFEITTERDQSQSSQLLKFIDDNPTVTKLLFDSILWSIFKSDIPVLFKSFQKIFLMKNFSSNLAKFDISQSYEVFNRINNILVNQEFTQSSIRIDQDLLRSNINYNKEKFDDQKLKTCVLAATPNFILLFNSFLDSEQVPHFLKVNLSTQNVIENNYISWLQMNVNAPDYYLASVGNDVLISDLNGSIQMFNMSCKPNKMISIRQPLFSHMTLPFVSDGFNIYSIMSNKEIGVYNLIKSKNSLTLIKKITINESTKLDSNYNDNVISNQFKKYVSLITNGIVLQIIFPEQVSNSNVVHFVRVISLITGNHIKDYRINLPFKIHSLSFDPLSRRIWTLTMKSHEVEFNQFKYNGPEPPWISNFEISTFSKFTKYSNFQSFIDFIIDYFHSISCQFFGSEFDNNEIIPNFLISSTNPDLVDLVLSLLSQPPNNVKYAQFLFIILSFQIKYLKIKKEQFDAIFNILKIYISNSNLYNFFALFIIQIAPYLKSTDLTRFFILYFKFLNTNNNFDFDVLLNLLLRLEKYKKFPYILDSQTLLQELLNQLSNETISEISFNFMMRYQASIFLHYSRIYKYKTQKIQKIETIIFDYTSYIFCEVTYYIQNMKSIDSLKYSYFSMALKKLLIELRLTANSSSFTTGLLSILQQSLTEFPKSRYFEKSVDNPLYLFFMDIFSLYVFSFKRLYSFSDLESIKKHIQFLSNEIEEEKNVSEVFNNNLTNDDFLNVVNSIYQKVPNPINKRLTQEDKEFEKTFFLSLIYKTQSIGEIQQINGQIKNHQNVQIPPTIKQIAQTIYRIRSSLKAKRQQGEQAEYLKLYQNYEEKTHFLLKLSNEKLDLKVISDFLNSDAQIYEIIQEKVKFESVKKNFALFIPMANSFIIRDLPSDLIYLFIMNISDNSDILNSYELIKSVIKIDLQSSDEIINNLLGKISKMPLNPILSFICYLLLMLSISYKQEELHKFLIDSIINIITVLCKYSKKIDRIIFKSCISLLSHFHRIINNEKLFEIKQEEKSAISKIFNNLDLKYSTSFTLSHSLYQGLFNIPISLNFISQITGYIGQPKFHSFSLVLFDYLQFFSENGKENEFTSSLVSIMDTIGTILSGSNSNNLLQIAVPLTSIETAGKSSFIRTPTSQLACILDLIQVIRRLILIKGSKSSKIIFNHFKKISEKIQLNDTKYMKQLYAMLAVMSNTIKVIRPYSIVKTSDNKTYFVLSLDEVNQLVEGLLLPISKQQIIMHTFDITSNIKSLEAIQYNLSLFKDFEVPFSLFKKATYIEKSLHSASLFKFYALQCIKENILDSEHGIEFSDIFFSKMKNKTIKHFMFSNHCSTILSLLKKSLALPDEGIFTNITLKPKFYHAQFSQIVFSNDFRLTDNEFKVDKCPHVFISSVINDSQPVYFCINYENQRQKFEFGIISHSLEYNKKISITYSIQVSQFFINGEKAIDHKIKEKTLIECKYDPIKNLVSFSDSQSNSLIFTCDLSKKSNCSFIILAYPGTELKYFCDIKPQTNCFLKNPTQTNNDLYHNSTKAIKKDYLEEIDNIIQYSIGMKKLKYKDTELNTRADSNNGTQLMSYAKFQNLPETDLFMATFPNAYFISLLNICSSPIQLNEYIQINEISGGFHLIQSKNAIIENSNSIPSFNCQKYFNLPSEVLNCYINQACEFYQQEILTLFAVNVLINSKDVYSTMNQYFIKTSSIVNFITSILFLLEPINFSNLEDQNSPIEFTSFNGFETCIKTDLYDYFTALKQIIDYFQENEKEKFILKWFKKLKEDFNNKYMHFVSQKNNGLITVRSSIYNTFQNFDLEDVTGWIVFPFKFGCYKMPQLSLNHIVFPRRFSDDANYVYSASRVLRIKTVAKDKDNNDLITFGILPIYKNSNESLFYSFYHLAVSFKYFVLFSNDRLLKGQLNHQIWKLVINSIAAGSPFFYTHSYTILSFLDKKIKMEASPENIALINGFNISNSIIKNKLLNQFIQTISFQFANKMAYELEDCILNNTRPPKSLTLKNPPVPQTISPNIDTELLYEIVSSILLFKKDSSRFPYYLIFNEWCESLVSCPPCEISVVRPNIISVTFSAFVPETFSLVTKDLPLSESVLISKTTYFDSNCRTMTMNYIRTGIALSNQLKPLNSPQNYYIKFTNSTRDVSRLNFIVFSEDRHSQPHYPDFVFDFKEILFRDINEWFTYSIEEDQKLLETIDSSRFTQQPIKTRPQKNDLINMTAANHKPHLNFFRFIYLFTINFLLTTNNNSSNSNLSNKPNRSELQRFISFNAFSKRFVDLINTKNGSSYINMTIDRQKGLDYRNGLNRYDQNSMIAQFAREYIRNPGSFRNPTTPFKIHYFNEEGIDVGGLMRDFFTELICDINTPRVGLFIQTPNGRIHEGSYQECIVPAPAPEISKSDEYYKAIGALIAIAVRTGMKQPDLVFPPFLWTYLITGRIDIKDVHSIDKSYKDVTSNLLNSASEMRDDEFDQIMSSTVVTNIRGAPIQLDLTLSKANCPRFVAMCNEVRLNELNSPLSKMKSGFWENLNIDVPPFVTSSLIEFLACGSRIINVDDLRRVTVFIAVEDTQKNFFWEVVARMKNDERKKLLHFATGLNSIGKNGLKVDHLGGEVDQHLPTASTCFFKLHLPSFSTADKMYNAFMIAINETGTFETS